MQTFRLAEIAQSKRRQVLLPPISDSIGARKEYLKTLRVMLRKLAAVVREDILPEAERELAARKADLTQDAMGDNAFERLGIVAAALRRTSEGMVGRIIDLEAGRHTNKWKASVRSALGIDVSTVVRQEDLSDYLQTAVRRNAALIQSLSADTIARVERATYDAVLQGKTVKDLRSQLTHEFGVLDSRAKLIARDQVSSLTADLNERVSTLPAIPGRSPLTVRSDLLAPSAYCSAFGATHEVGSALGAGHMKLAAVAGTRDGSLDAVMSHVLAAW